MKQQQGSTGRRTRGLAKILRKNQTDVENYLWQFLRAKRLMGYKFRRQHPVGKFILDFYCAARKLAIEVDGGQHNDPEQISYDRVRTRVLAGYGIKVMRFWDLDVLQDVDSVLDAIVQELEN
jgi:very-short-patch-repair endonuclease